MDNILNNIIYTKKQEVSGLKKAVSIHELELAIERQSNTVNSLAKALINEVGIVAEFKRASPSKGIINENVTVEEIVGGYSTNGAAGISVLTDVKYFKAEDKDFEKARLATLKPLLRKEFIIDEYQLVESKAMGANVVLLIAAVLSKEKIRRFTRVAHSLDMEVLLELHSEDELQKICGEEDLIGINNRNLKTFEVSIEHSIQIKRLLGSVSKPMLSESGLSKIEHVEILINEGFRGFLMGEYFMKQRDPVSAFSLFNKELNNVAIR